MGIYLLMFGVGAFILPMVGLQFTILSVFGESLPLSISSSPTKSAEACFPLSARVPLEIPCRAICALYGNVEGVAGAGSSGGIRG
jgi:hypothetical protein